MNKFFALILLVMCSTVCRATNYYFSITDGDDGRTNIQARDQTTPWKTISKLNSILSTLNAGDAVLFKSGDVFYGSIVINKSGSSGAPITFGAYGTGPAPIISGFTAIASGDWSSIGSNLWQSGALTDGLSTMGSFVIGGVFEPYSRWPKLTGSNGGYLTVGSSSGGTSLTSSGLSGAFNYAGGEIVFRKSNFIIDRETVSSNSGTSITFSHNNTAYPIQNGWGFFIQNHPNACTQQGEWAYTSSTKKVTVYSTSAPDAQASTIQNLVVIGNGSTGYQYLTFTGLTFEGANTDAFVIQKSGHITIQNCTMRFCGKDGVGGDAFVGTSTGNTITRNNIHDFGNGGIHLWDDFTNTTITTDTITNCGNIAGMGGSQDEMYEGIQCKANGAIITGCIVQNVGYIGIMMRGTNGLVQNCFVNNYCLVKSDGGGIYTGRNNSITGRKILNNVVVNGYGSAFGTTSSTQLVMGVYLDDLSNDVEVGGNSIGISNCYGIFMHGATNINIHDNTIYDCKLGCMGYLNETNSMTGIVLTNNIFFAKTASEYVTYCGTSPTSPATFFTTADNNYWCRPINESGDFRSDAAGGSGTFSLSTWKTFIGKEASSHITPVTISDVGKLRFEYNGTASSKMVSLGAFYIDAKNVSYPGSLTLLPYTSRVLIQSNSPPQIITGADIVITLPVDSAQLTSTITDVDGSVVSRLWTKISGAAVTIVTPTLNNTEVRGFAAGSYVFQVSATDNLGLVSTKNVNVTVNPAVGGGNIPPVSNAGSDQTITLPVSTVALSGTGSSDADGSIASYTWAKVSGPSSFTIASPTSADTDITGLVSGTYKFQLTVVDDLGAVDVSTVNVQVGANVSNSIRIKGKIIFQDAPTI